MPDSCYFKSKNTVFKPKFERQDEDIVHTFSNKREMCRISWRWRSFQGLVCSPIKILRELGSNRRKTGWSLSGASVESWGELSIVKVATQRMKIFCGNTCSNWWNPLNLINQWSLWFRGQYQGKVSYTFLLKFNTPLTTGFLILSGWRWMFIHNTAST